MSVDACLAGAIIGKGGVNSKQIVCVTGAKLAIREHEIDPSLRNIELEGTFDQIPSYDDGSNIDKDVHNPDENIYPKVSSVPPGLDGDELTATPIPEQPNTESSNQLHMMSAEILVKQTGASPNDVEM